MAERFKNTGEIMTPLQFTIYGNPKPLKRHATYTKDKRGNYFKVPIQVDRSKLDKDNFLAMCMQYRQDNMPYAIALELNIVCYFERPNNHYGTGKNIDKIKYNAPIFHTTKPDSDNIIKFIADALNGIFWKDDSFLSIIKLTKLYANDRTPRMEISIKESVY
jgi:Holliday junction resolvase RusA-like endonuclease